MFMQTILPLQIYFVNGFIANRFYTETQKCCGDILITDGCVAKLGNLSIEARYTQVIPMLVPSDQVGNMIFTGDALLIDGCGRTDFQQGNAGTLMTVFINNFLACLTRLLCIRDNDYALSSVFNNWL